MQPVWAPHDGGIPATPSPSTRPGRLGASAPCPSGRPTWGRVGSRGAGVAGRPASIICTAHPLLAGQTFPNPSASFPPSGVTTQHTALLRAVVRDEEAGRPPVSVHSRVHADPARDTPVSGGLRALWRAVPGGDTYTRESRAFGATCSEDGCVRRPGNTGGGWAVRGPGVLPEASWRWAPPTYLPLGAWLRPLPPTGSPGSLLLSTAAQPAAEAGTMWCRGAGRRPPTGTLGVCGGLLRRQRTSTHKHWWP